MVQVWVVNFFLNNKHAHTSNLQYTRIFDTKEAILEYLKMFDFEMSQVRFEAAIGYENLGECYVRYYPHKDDRSFRGELQWVYQKRT